VTGVTVFHGGPWDGQMWRDAAPVSTIPVPGAPPPPPRAYWPVVDNPQDSAPPVAGRYEVFGQDIPIGLYRVLRLFVWRPAVTGPPPARPELPVRELRRLEKLMFQHPDLVDHG
jgi:hypothetical protein